jgi:hypothetical protein
MPIGVLTLTLNLDGCRSLKDKRRRLKPLLARLHREFNVSAAEMAHHDVWQTAEIGCVILSTDYAHAEQKLQQIVAWMEQYWRDVYIVQDEIELI